MSQQPLQSSFDPYTPLSFKKVYSQMRYQPCFQSDAQSRISSQSNDQSSTLSCNQSQSQNINQKLSSDFSDMNLIKKSSKWLDTENFNKLKKIPQDYTCLRQTINVYGGGGYHGYDGSHDIDDKNDSHYGNHHIQSNFRNQKPSNFHRTAQIETFKERHQDMYKKKLQKEQYDFLRNTVNYSIDAQGYSKSRQGGLSGSTVGFSKTSTHWRADNTSQINVNGTQKLAASYNNNNSRNFHHTPTKLVTTSKDLNQKVISIQTSKVYNPYSSLVHGQGITVNTNDDFGKGIRKRDIDYKQLAEKLKDNADMISELRRLKQQRKNRIDHNNVKNRYGGTILTATTMTTIMTQNKSPQHHQYQYRKLSSKDFDIPPLTNKKSYEENKKRYNQHSYDQHIVPIKQQQNKLLKSKQYNTPNTIKSTHKLYSYKHSHNSNSKHQLPTPISNQNKSSHESHSIHQENNRSKSPLNHFKPNHVKQFSLPMCNSINSFVLTKALGEGKFGTVYLSFHKFTGAVFAIKKVPKQMIRTHMLVEQFLLQVKLQSYFNNGNIVKLFGLLDDKDSIYLVMEYMEEGTLFTYLKKNKTIGQNQAAAKIKDVVNAVESMHAVGVAHRDIKPQNIVMSNGVCKLCDFGWATICNQRRKTYCGTFDYAAPEILQGVQYDMTVDLWCLGVLAYELMVGKAPFYHLSRKETMKKIINVQNSTLSFPPHLSSKATSFINKLIKKNPEERMKSEEILDHPFLAAVQDNLAM